MEMKEKGKNQNNKETSNISFGFDTHTWFHEYTKTSIFYEVISKKKRLRAKRFDPKGAH